MQGWRTEMEDEHTINTDIGIEGHSLYAVFDGHGGRNAAIFASRYLTETFQQTLAFARYLDSKVGKVSTKLRLRTLLTDFKMFLRVTNFRIPKCLARP